LTVLASTRNRAGTMEAVEIRSGQAMWLPLWLARPASPPRPLRCAIVLDPAGRNALWQEGGILETLAAAGWAACAPDLRGIGDLRGEYPRGSVRHAADHANEEAYAWASLWLGRPLLGQRVGDILTVARALRNEPGWAEARLVVAASGQLAVPALCAALFDATIAGLYLASPLVSFRALVEAGEYRHPFSNFVPGILATTDLPQVVRALAPRPVVLAGTVSAAGETLAPVEVSRVYAALPGVSIAPSAEWSPAGLHRNLDRLAGASGGPAA
jgi:hypothetical protein